MIRRLLALLCLTAAAWAQDRTSSITGVITDPSGALVRGIVITARDAATGTIQTTVTQGDGSYRLVKLPLGAYTVTAEHDGFKTERRDGVIVGLDRTSVVNIEMQVGQHTEVVTVTAEEVQAETTSSAITHLVDVATIQELSLIHI